LDNPVFNEMIGLIEKVLLLEDSKLQNLHYNVLEILVQLSMKYQLFSVN